MTYGVSMNMQSSLDSTNSFFFNKLFADCFYFSFTKLFLIKRSAFCFNKNNITMFAKKSLMPCIIFALFSYIFSSFFSEKITIFVLTNCFIICFWSCHKKHLLWLIL